MCWMIKQEAPEYKRPKEQLRAYAEQATTKGHRTRTRTTRDRGIHGALTSADSEQAAAKGKGHGLGPPGVAAFTGSLRALPERDSAVGATNAAGVENLKQLWEDLEPESLGTSLQAGQSLRPCSVPSRARHQRGRASRTHSWGTRTNRSESSSRSSAKRSVGTGTVFIDRTELKKVNFVAASRPDSPDRPLARSVHWRKNFASDKDIMDRATGNVLGTGGGAASSTLGQLPTSAEIEEVRRVPCEALDLEFAAEEDAAREMYSQSDI